ncbi:MAG: restriction endonuclease subunit S [Microcystis sp.]|uniref:restriction endonuclease subunit S n=1 Tax=Microcystis sp. TaxID=1127 RepID=UPI00391F07ED
MKLYTSNKGVFPDDWKIVKLGSLCDLQNGYAFKSTDYVDSSNTLSCRMSNIRPDGEFDLDYHPKFLPDPYADKYQQFLLKDNDVIIAMTDMATEPKILGVPTVVSTKGRNVLLNQRVGKLVIKDKDSIFFPYLKRVLGTNRAKQHYLRFAGGGVQINLSKEDLLSLEIPLPPIEEQRRIAAILDKADGVRRKRKEAIRLTEELLKSTFLEMFGDPVTNPKGWEVRELGDCVKDIESGWSPKCDTRQAEPEEWGVLKLGAVTYGHFNPDENKAMLPDDVPRQELEIKTGDLLVTRKNTYELVGASAFVQMTRPKLMLPDLIFRLRLIDGIDPVYVWQTLSQKTMRLKLSGLAGGTAGSMPNISKARLRTLPFPVPPQLLQLKYREIFNQFWLKKEHQKESEEISENLFNSLLQKAFRGEL